MKNFLCLIILFFLSSCGLPHKKSVQTNQQSWAVVMADATIARFDSLIYYNNNPKAEWEYDYAFLGLAIDRLGNIDSKYSKYMQDYIDYFVGEDGSIKTYKPEEYYLDRINPGKNLIALYKRTGNNKYKIAIETLVRQIESHPKTKSEGFWHKKIYPWQMWLDGIYMAPPFLAQYAREFNQPQWFDIITYQIKHIRSKTLDPKTGLLYHAWDESKQQRWCNPETGQSKHFWSRAMGWYLMAIVDVLDHLPADHPDRNNLITILQETCSALLKIKDKETGLWYQVLDMGGREGNYLEASGSAMYTYVFAKGAKNGYLDNTYLDIASQSFEAMIKTFITHDKNGQPSLQNVCGGCGLGGNPYRNADYEYYINEKVITNDPKGVAPFILAAIELKM